MDIQDVLTDTQRFWYIIIHNWMFITSGLLLWGTFVFVALIARRYELVLHKSTKWQYMLFAPSGILIFVLLTAIAYIQAKVIMSSFQRWIAYFAFLFSGLFSLGGIIQFLQIIAPSFKKGS